MKASGSDSAAVVEFTGKVQRIARVHQYGLRDKPRYHSHYIKYQKRQLLGLSKAEQDVINNLVIGYLE